MGTTLSLLAVGFFLGMRHATDADHVIAISTIVSRQRSMRSAAMIGVLWGVGHTLTVMLVGGAIILFTITIPPRAGLAMEFAVGVMLVLLGFLNLTGLNQWIRDNVAPGSSIHGHTHAHGDYAHSHVHGHGPARHGHNEEQTPQAWLDRKLGGIGLYQMARPLVVGIVHGLAGSAAVALSGADCDRRSAVGNGVPVPFRCGHHCRNDADHDGDRRAFCLFDGTLSRASMPTCESLRGYCRLDSACS